MYTHLLNEFESTKTGISLDIKIAAIDNGVAFPTEHFGTVRKFVYQWVQCPESEMPFDDRLANDVLKHLDGKRGFNGKFLERILGNVKHLFRLDASFKEEVFRNQAKVFRGQAANLVQALKQRLTPRQLVELPAIAIDKIEGEDGTVQYV